LIFSEVGLFGVHGPCFKFSSVIAEGVVNGIALGALQFRTCSCVCTFHLHFHLETLDSSCDSTAASVWSSGLVFGMHQNCGWYLFLLIPRVANWCVDDSVNSRGYICPGICLGRSL